LVKHDKNGRLVPPRKAGTYYLKEPYTEGWYGVDYAFNHAPATRELVKWNNKLFMAAKQARRFIRIKEVRQERLQAITTADIIAEGVELPQAIETPNPTIYRAAWVALWDSINGSKEGCAWEDNPFVWVYEYENCEHPFLVNT
jgi:hypothetical protein